MLPYTSNKPQTDYQLRNILEFHICTLLALENSKRFHNDYKCCVHRYPWVHTRYCMDIDVCVQFHNFGVNLFLDSSLTRNKMTYVLVTSYYFYYYLEYYYSFSSKHFNIFLACNTLQLLLSRESMAFKNNFQMSWIFLREGAVLHARKI